MEFLPHVLAESLPVEGCGFVHSVFNSEVNSKNQSARFEVLAREYLQIRHPGAIAIMKLPDGH